MKIEDAQLYKDYEAIKFINFKEEAARAIADIIVTENLCNMIQLSEMLSAAGAYTLMHEEGDILVIRNAKDIFDYYEDKYGTKEES